MALFTQGQKIEVIVRKEDTSAATAGANDTSAEEATSGTSAGASGAGTYAGSYAASGKVNKRIIGSIMTTRTMMTESLTKEHGNHSQLLIPATAEKS